jgi:hypothetical protein
MKQQQARQGDVLLIPCDEPSNAMALKPDGDRVILAHGETTGHAHAFDASKAMMYAVAGALYVKVLERALLRHEEHPPIEYAPGWYEIPGQREYVGERTQNVAD